MLRAKPTQLLLAASFLALVFSFAGLFAVVLLGHKVYVDEAALLAGMADGPPPVALAPACAASGVEARLIDRLRELGASPERYVSSHAGNCSCTSLSAVVRGLRADGSEALLLAVELSDADSLAHADGRAAELVLALSEHLSQAAWLAKDVLLLLHPRCSCACAGLSPLGRGASASCDRGPVESFLREYHVLDALRAEDRGVRGAPAPGARVRV